MRDDNEKRRKESWETLARLGGREAIEEFRQEMGITLEELTTSNSDCMCVEMCMCVWCSVIPCVVDKR